MIVSFAVFFEFAPSFGCQLPLGFFWSLICVLLREPEAERDTLEVRFLVV